MNRVCCFLVFAIFLITSCREDESPQSYLNGTYENTGTNSETGISYVSQYIFKGDGTFERIGLMRQDGQLLGYNFYSKGTYSLHGEEFTVSDGQMAGVNYGDYPEGYVASLELLENYAIEPLESKGTLRQLDGGDRIGILLECNDMIGYAAMCMGEQIYEKID